MFRPSTAGPFGAWSLAGKIFKIKNFENFISIFLNYYFEALFLKFESFGLKMIVFYSGNGLFADFGHFWLKNAQNVILRSFEGQLVMEIIWLEWLVILKIGQFSKLPTIPTKWFSIIFDRKSFHEKSVPDFRGQNFQNQDFENFGF